MNMDIDRSAPFFGFSDGIALRGGPFGYEIVFKKHPQTRDVSPPPPGAPELLPEPPATIATISVTMEHAKIIAFHMWRQILQLESGSGVVFPLPPALLDEMAISPQEWTGFWGGSVPEPVPFPVNGTEPIQETEVERLKRELQVAESTAEAPPSE